MPWLQHLEVLCRQSRHHTLTLSGKRARGNRHFLGVRKVLQTSVQDASLFRLESIIPTLRIHSENNTGRDESSGLDIT